MPVSFAEGLKTNYTLDNINKTDYNESCGVTAAKNLLESEKIAYNQSELEKCICENSTECNADILTIRQCLNEEGLITYAYTVNESQLQTGDIIHFDFNGTGHYEVFKENITDLKGFKGHIITIRELEGQKTISLIRQEELKGKIAPVAFALIMACLESGLCEIALHLALDAAHHSIDWCISNPNDCKKYVSTANAAVVQFPGTCDHGSVNLTLADA